MIFTLKTTTIDGGSCVFCNDEPIVMTKIKDSLGYLVEVGGPIIFSSTNEEDYQTASYAYGTIFKVLKQNEVLITVPAGQFVTKDNERNTVKPDGTRFEGTDNNYFTDGIGEIRQTYSGVTRKKIIHERQLISFNLGNGS